MSKKKYEFGVQKEVVDIYMEHGELLVSSLNIARDFNRRHDVIYKTIASIIKNIPAGQKTTAKFYKSTFENKQHCHFPMYYMNIDGFWLLMSRLVVKDNLEQQIKYANAFAVAKEYAKEQERRCSNPFYRLIDIVKKWFEKEA